MATGKIVQVIGTVVDVEFPAEELPNLFDALELDNAGEKLILEVQQHIGNNWVRCLAMDTTDGLRRGTKAVDTGSRLNQALFAQQSITGESGGGDPIERYLNGVIIYGTPDEVVDEIQRLKEEMYLGYLLCAPLSHSTFMLFTEKVLLKIL